MWRTLWLGLSSASSNMIRGLRLCTKRTLSGLALVRAKEVRTKSLFTLMVFLSPLESLALPRPAGQTPPAGSGGGFLEAGNRSCVPRSSERLCRTRRTWALHLCPHHSAPWRIKWKNKFPNPATSALLFILFTCYPKRTIFCPICGNNVMSLEKINHKRLNTSLVSSWVHNLLQKFFFLFFINSTE